MLTCCGSNRHETSDHTLYCANDRWLFEVNGIAECPSQKAHRRTDVSVEDSYTGIRTRSVRITTVESIPANPKDACTDHCEQNVVGSEIDAVFIKSWPNPVCTDKASGPRREVNDIAARIIDHTSGRQETPSPQAKGADGVRKGEPEGYEKHPGKEVHATEEGTSHDDQGNRREDKLEVYHRRHRIQRGDA